jgi:hypothetical protein
MSQEEAIKLVAEFGDAATAHYMVVNGERRGKPEKAAERELRAAQKLVKALTGSNAIPRDLETALW